MFTFAGDAQLENLILKESALVSVFCPFKYLLSCPGCSRPIAHNWFIIKLDVILKQQRWLKIVWKYLDYTLW